MQQKHIQKLTSFFFEIGNLRWVLRAHQQMLMTSDPTDNIASHSFRSAFIGYFIAKELKADADKVLKMCLLHDIEEVRTGDHNWVHRRYVKIFDDEVRAQQLNNFAGAEELIKISDEYAERKTMEAKIAKDADLLDEIFLLREYARQGNKEAEFWLEPGDKDGNQQIKHMSTDLAKQIAKEAKKQNPNVWWFNLWTPNKRK